MIIAKYPITPPQHRLNKTTSQNPTVLVSGDTNISLNKSRQNKNPEKLDTMKSRGIKIDMP